MSVNLWGACLHTTEGLVVALYRLAVHLNLRLVRNAVVDVDSQRDVLKRGNYVGTLWYEANPLETEPSYPFWKPLLPSPLSYRVVEVNHG